MMQTEAHFASTMKLDEVTCSTVTSAGRGGDAVCIGRPSPGSRTIQGLFRAKVPLLVSLGRNWTYY